MKWDESFDVVVVGSGASGLAAGLTAQLKGLTSLVLEKTDKFGGASAISGGGVWIPLNHYLEAAGKKDTRENARNYLDATIGGVVPSELKEAYLTHGPGMLRFFHEKTDHMRFTYVPKYSDYYPEYKGGDPTGRCIEADVFDMRKLGDDAKNMRGSAMDTKGMTLTSEDFRKVSMIKRTFEAKKQAVFKVGMRLIHSKLTGAKPVALGASLIGRLMLSYKEKNGELWLNTAFKDYVVENGRVIGVVVEKEGKELYIEARKGVLMASGGFSHNTEYREKYLPAPTNAKWSSSPEGQTGDILAPSIGLDAELKLMDKVWGAPSAVTPDGRIFFFVAERAMPNMIIVDGAGKRYLNEAVPYHEFVDKMYAHHSDKTSAIPSWFVIDQTAKDRYIMMQMFPGQKFPEEWLESYIKSDNTIEGLAQKMGVDPKTFKETVERFNGFVEKGKDEDFHRGDSAYDRYYGDPSLPNPNLDKLMKAPYYAIPIYPGDIGTKGGVVINENASVMRKDGTPIEGLYAAGNCSAAVMGTTYPGPGATIGPGMTFGYIAVNHMQENANNPLPKKPVLTV